VRFFGYLCLILTAAAGEPGAVSPTVERLRVAPGGEARFWRSVERDGAPIVEAASEKGYSLVTYIWHGSADTRNVVVHGDGTPGAPSSNQLTRIDGTSVWYRTYRYRSDARFRYSLSPNDDLRPMETVPPAEFGKRMATFVSDPLNPHKSSGGLPMSDLSLPDAPEQPYFEGAAPSVEKRSFRDWPLQIYRPAQANGPLPVLLLFDGSSYATEMRAATTVENLIRLGRIRPVMLVMIENPPGKRNAELTCSEEFTKMLGTELVPWLRSNYAVSEERVGVGGMSYGGLAAAFAALRRPEVFGGVLSQSGSYWWKPREAESWAWLTEQYRAAQRTSTRFYLEVGLMEIGTPGGRPSMLESNRRMRDLLLSQGVEVAYSEFNGDHTALNWRGSFADGLVALYGK
jgi:enterochelin esterase-like enzyme